MNQDKTQTDFNCITIKWFLIFKKVFTDPWIENIILCKLFKNVNF